MGGIICPPYLAHYLTTHPSSTTLNRSGLDHPSLAFNRAVRDQDRFSIEAQMLRITSNRIVPSSKLLLRSISTKGPVEAKITSGHPTHKQKDEKVLAKAREVANNSELQQSTHGEVVWTGSQQPRQDAWRGPRFEQTDLSLQPQPQPAIELIAKQPIRYETRRVVSCNGGGGPLGHPKVYINLDKAGEPNVCPYCE